MLQQTYSFLKENKPNPGSVWPKSVRQIGRKEVFFHEQTKKRFNRLFLKNTGKKPIEICSLLRVQQRSVEKMGDWSIGREIAIVRNL
jgi:hypothetical protein